MRSTIRALVFGVALGGGISAPALADPIERYFELQEVIEQINDPDPLMRIALLEEILASDDATRVQLAIRAAMTIDEPNIRSLALRTHFAAYNEFIISFDYPEEIQAAMNGGDTEALENFRSNSPRMFYTMSEHGGQFKLQSESTSLHGDSFDVVALNNISGSRTAPGGSGNIRGALITIQTEILLFSNINRLVNCGFEFSQYEGLTVHGIGSCDSDDMLAFPVTLHLFEPPQENVARQTQ